MKISDNLRARCKEILNWRKTGLLQGMALYTMANERWPNDPHQLQLAESETIKELLEVVDKL